MLASRYWPRANVMSFNPLALLVLVSVALLASGGTFLQKPTFSEGEVLDWFLSVNLGQPTLRLT
jgi:hypothetical protein